MSKDFDTRVLAEVAISVALAYVLNLIIIFNMPQGGSITLGSMVPILLVALRRGPKIGIFAGTVFGFVQMFLGGYWFTLAQVILDYPVAFACLGLAGIFRDKPMLGVTVALLGRFIAHFVSGVVFFGQWAPPELGPYLYSAIYNGSYLVPELVISAALIYMLIQRGILEYSV
ncbi:MAG: energy-coupled thiamine transporter ThiT [Candidatus Bathyarchaeota archaeon]|nr:energy-coupled thiamine transporter ThiT [Candidatus Bathyarchaeota archaeon]